jgi:hypothetical protein
MKLFSTLTLGLLFLGIASAIPSQDTRALSGSDFNPGYIIDDAVFYNDNALDAGSIQTFLNNQVPNCDTNGSRPASEFGRSDITRAQYAASRGWHGPPYTCMRDYKQNTPNMEAASGLCNAISAKNNQSAAQIINDISKACHLNPQVLLVLLQKEQSLVIDTWPLNGQYRNATGFACPDTAPCDPAYNGFFYQVYYAARQFQIYKANPLSYNYVAGRNNNIYYNPDLSRCGSSSIYIQNQATAALYIYTPYQPNSAALNNLYGTGNDCSSYGNRNFWRLFNDWFGSTTIGISGAILERHNQLGGANGVLGPAIGNQTCNLRDNGCYQPFRNGGIYWTQKTGAYESYGEIRQRYYQMGTENSSLGYPNEGVICGLKDNGCYQRYQKGVIYYSPKVGRAYENMDSIRERYLILGTEHSSLGYPSSPKICGLRDGGCYQGFENGAIYWSLGSGTYDTTGPIRARYVQMSAESGQLQYPTSAPICTLKDSGCVQFFRGGKIYYSPAVGKAYEAIDSISQRYDITGNENGHLGYPSSPKICGLRDGGCYQGYQNGAIYWSPKSGTYDSYGALRTRHMQLFGEGGSLGYPTGVPIYNSDKTQGSQKFQYGTLQWSSANGYNL